MDVELLSRSAVGIASLRDHGRALASTEIPRLFGRRAAIDRAEEHLAAARKTITELEAQLREAGLGPAADALRGAQLSIDGADMSRYGPITAGNGLASAADSVRYRMDVELAAAARSVLRMPTSALEDTQLLQLSRIVHLDRNGGLLGLAGPVANVRDLTQLVTAADDVAGARTLHESWNAATVDATRLRGDVHELVTRDVANFDQRDRDRVSELLALDPAGEVLTGPRDLRHAPESFYERYLPAWDVATVSPEEQGRVAREILDTPTTDVTAAQWRQLQQLVDDRSARIELHAALEGRDPRTLIAAAGGGLGESVARRLHADRTVGRLDDAGRIELARSLVSRSPERLVESEWALLESLTRTDVGGPRKLDGINSLDDIARAQTHQILRRPSDPWNAAAYFGAWNEALDPAYGEKVTAAVESVAAGRPTPGAIDLLLIERQRLGTLLADSSPEAQRNVVAALLSNSRLSTPGDSGQVLALARTGLANATDVHPALEPLRQQTLELIDLNLERIAGRHRDDAVRGYSNHPDYAEVGRIRANLDLIVNASRSRSVDGQTHEILTW